MTDKELFDTMQEALDEMDTRIADLPNCSIRNLMMDQRKLFDDFLQLVKRDDVVRESYKKFNEELDRYESSGFDESTKQQFAWEACLDLGTMDYVANKMIGGDDDEHYHKEVLRVDGSLKAYIVVQNDWTGSTIGYLRDIHLEGNTYYARADGMRVNVTEDRYRCLRREDEVNTALEWYRKTKF